MKLLERFGPILLVLFSLVVLGSFWYVTLTRTLTSLESFFWQLIGIFAGLAGSFYFGRQSAREAAREIIKPHARSAFRRLVFLYRSIYQIGSIIHSSRASKSPENYQVILAEIDGIVFGQLATAEDALEDWRDIVPEDVEELDQRPLRRQHNRG